MNRFPNFLQRCFHHTRATGKTTKKKVNKHNWTGKVTLPGKKDGIVLVCVNVSKKITETISLQTFIKAK